MADAAVIDPVVIDPVIPIVEPLIDPALAEPKPKDGDPKEPDPKAESRAAFEARKAREELDKTKRELEGFRRREEEARKAKLTDEQRQKEESDSLKEELETLKREKMQAEVAAKYKIPAALAHRIIGSDMASMEADAEELSKIVARPKVGTTTEPSRDTQSSVPGRIFKATELNKNPGLVNDPEFKKALAEGRVVQD